MNMCSVGDNNRLLLWLIINNWIKIKDHVLFSISCQQNIWNICFFLLLLHRRSSWNKKTKKQVHAPSHLMGQKGTGSRLAHTLWLHSAARKHPKKRGRRRSWSFMVVWCVSQPSRALRGKQPELNSLNSSDILHLSWAGNALCASGEGITDKREVSCTAGGRVMLSGPRGDGAEASSILPLWINVSSRKIPTSRDDSSDLNRGRRCTRCLGRVRQVDVLQLHQLHLGRGQRTAVSSLQQVWK